MSSFKIRQASHEDAETLGHIGVATFVESYTADIEGRAMVTHCTREHNTSVYEQYLAAPQTGCWLAEHSKTSAPIGYALNCAPDLPVDIIPGDLELKRIYVLSKFHGSDCALGLLEAAEVHARTQNAPRLLLGTYEENHRAVAFYEKHGFKTIGTRQFNVGGKIYDDIVMGKTL